MSGGYKKDGENTPKKKEEVGNIKGQKSFEEIEGVGVVKEKDNKQDIEEDWEEVELFWNGVPGIEFSEKEQEDVSQFCDEMLNDEEYFVLSDYWVSNLLKELNGI